MSICIIIDRSEGMQHLSESVYNELCLIVGTLEQVAIRREIANFEEMVLRPVEIINEINVDHIMLSGSRREGFKLRGSDHNDVVKFITSDHGRISIGILRHIGKCTIIV